MILIFLLLLTSIISLPYILTHLVSILNFVLTIITSSDLIKEIIIVLFIVFIMFFLIFYVNQINKYLTLPIEVTNVLCENYTQ